MLGVADPIKETTREAIKQLHEQGIRIVMLTGDSRTTANAVASKLGIDEVVAEVLPNQKAEIIKRYQAEGRKVAMAGDGINDAPALAQADVGIAMGTGTDVAMESAERNAGERRLAWYCARDTTEPGDNEEHQTEPFLCLCLQCAGRAVAAGVLYPFFGILLSPMIAAAAMSFSSVSVIGNALRLRRLQL